MTSTPAARPPFATPKYLLAVFVGGTIGTSIRALIEATWPTSTGAWPFATFVINMTGSLILGFLYATLARSGPDEGWRRMLRIGGGTGVLGGYTTYSTFIVEADSLAAIHWPIAAAYAIVSVVAGILLAAFGAQLAGWLVALLRDRRGES